MQPQRKGHVHEMIVTARVSCGDTHHCNAVLLLPSGCNACVVHCSLGSHQLSILLPPSAAHCKGAAGLLVVIASAYHLCSVHVLCVCVLFVITCCVYHACWCGSVLCDQEHTFHP